MCIKFLYKRKKRCIIKELNNSLLDYCALCKSKNNILLIIGENLLCNDCEKKYYHLDNKKYAKL